jgi:hypothetical protein
VDRVKRDRTAQLDLLTYDSAQALVDVDGSNAPTIAVTDSVGTTVAGFTPSRTTTGTYKATFPANFDVLDTYEVLWTWPNGQSERTEFELVGGFLFSIADLRAFFVDFQNVTNYPLETMKQTRSMVEDVFEGELATNRAFRPRGRRLVRDGSGREVLVTPDFDITSVISVAAVSSDGSAYTVNLSDVKIESHGVLTLRVGTWPQGVRNVTVLYEYGLRSVPAIIRTQALKYAKALLLEKQRQSNLDGASSWSTADLRIERATTTPTGLPEVDAVLAQWSMVGVAVA